MTKPTIHIIQNGNNCINHSGFNLNHRGFAYGDGFFSTMGVYQGKILWRDYHHRRFVSHAKALHLALSVSDIDALMSELIHHAQKISEGVLKVIITRQQQEVRGYGFQNGKAEVALKIMPMRMPAYHRLSIEAIVREPTHNFSRGFLSAEFFPVQQSGEAICLDSQISCQPKSLAGLKTLSCLDSVMVSGEFERVKSSYVSSSKHKILEGLVSDISKVEGNQRNWVEGVMSNVFYRLSDDYHTNHSDINTDITDQWYTPPILQSGVNGVMRQVLMEQVSNFANPVIERPLVDNDLMTLSQMFFCNAVRGIIPIHKLHLRNGHAINLSINL